MDEITEIVKLQLNRVSRMLEKNDVVLKADHEAVKLIARKSYDPQYGARPLKRTIQKDVLNELSKRILDGSIHRAGIVKLTVKNGDLQFVNE
jgi:ATP-dependent Clp protease ATP-binding subunit ClpB